MRKYLLWLVGGLIGLLGAYRASGQAAAPLRLFVTPGPVAVDQPLEMNLELTGVPLETLGVFPDLPGFKKMTRTRRTTTRIVGQASTTTLTITQRYLAFGEGEKTLPPFTIQVNGQAVRYAGGKVRITAAGGVAPPDKKPGSAVTLPPDAVGYGMADELFGKPKAQEYRDVPDQARLTLEVTPRAGVWAGEGVRARLYLTIAPEDQAVLEFAADFGHQMDQLRRQVKPPDVWEEMPPDSPTLPDTLRLPEGQVLLRFLLHDAIYYPLTAAQALRFPAVSLRLVKYRLAKKPVEGADNRLATSKTLVTTPVEVPVRALPPHPLRDVVPVGQFRLREELRHNPARVNQPSRYWVEIAGPGNLAPVRFPEPLTKEGTGLSAYRPQVQLTPAWPPAGRGATGGTLRFQWELVAERPGLWPLDSLIQLVYFDPVRGRYDTLRSHLQWQVTGQAAIERTAAETPWANDDFYRRIDREALTVSEGADPAQLRRLANGALTVLAALAGWLIWRRRG